MKTYLTLFKIIALSLKTLFDILPIPIDSSKKGSLSRNPIFTAPPNKGETLLAAYL